MMLRSKKEQRSSPSVLAESNRAEQKWGLQSLSPPHKGEDGWLGFQLRDKGLILGLLQGVHVLSNCFFFRQAGFAPHDHSSQEREAEKATDRLGK